MEEVSRPLVPKLCKNCKWFQVSFMERILFMTNFGKCGRPGMETKDNYTLVIGEKPKSQVFASVEREDYKHIDHCGTKAKYWEPK